MKYNGYAALSVPFISGENISPRGPRLAHLQCARRPVRRYLTTTGVAEGGLAGLVAATRADA